MSNSSPSPINYSYYPYTREYVEIARRRMNRSALTTHPPTIHSHTQSHERVDPVTRDGTRPGPVQPRSRPVSLAEPNFRPAFHGARLPAPPLEWPNATSKSTGCVVVPGPAKTHGAAGHYKSVVGPRNSERPASSWEFETARARHVPRSVFRRSHNTTGRVTHKRRPYNIHVHAAVSEYTRAYITKYIFA